MANEGGIDGRRWTQDGADRLMRSAELLVTAIRDHAVGVASASGRGDLSIVFGACDALVQPILDYAQAQSDYTGFDFPFGVVRRFVEQEARGSNDADDQDAASGALSADVSSISAISVLQRHDFAVIDEDAVLAAGRDAYREVWSDDVAEDPADDVTTLGRALYQIAHAGGWNSLAHVDGLQPLGGIVEVLEPSTLLSHNPDEWTSEAFSTDGAQIYRQLDVWR